MFARPSRLIIAQYAPPAGFSVLAAAELLGESKSAVAAQLIDLAVRGFIGVERGASRKEGFALILRAVPADDGTAAIRDDLDVLGAVFGGFTPGTRVVLAPSTRRQIGVAVRGAHRNAVARLVGAGLVRQRGVFEKAVVFWRKQPTEPTERAHPYVDHLWGVRDYIAWAEADRLAFLQSPSGAEVRELDGVALLRLHERLLPYAVLFGLEKEWRRELALRFESVQPELDVTGTLEVLHLAVTVADAAAGVAEVAQFLPDLDGVTDLVDLGAAADGIGAFFGGLGELLGALDV